MTKGGDSNRYHLNVSGRKFEISSKTYLRMQHTLNLLETDMKTDARDIFMERSPNCMESIISFFQGHSLHMPAGVCPAEFKEELEFWDIPISKMSRCCFTKFLTFADDQKHLDRMEHEEKEHEKETSDLKHRTNGKGLAKFQAIVWQILQEPSSSKIAKVYSYISCIIIAISVLSLVCSTHPVFKRDLREEEWKDFFEDDFHFYQGHFSGDDVQNTSLPGLPNDAKAHVDFIVYTELITVAFFSVEILLRVAFCPFRLAFFKSILNWIDIFSIVTMYSKYIVEAVDTKEKYQASIFDIVHCLQIVRVFRLFRLVKNFVGFRVLLHAFKSSLEEMLLMSMLLLVSMLFFSSFAFFSGDDVFLSIPDSFWWSIVTMTTVGYGDVVPKNSLSKTVGALCAITGVLILAVVIPVFVNNFLLFYSYSKLWKYNENENPSSQSGRSARNGRQNVKTIDCVKVMPINN